MNVVAAAAYNSLMGAPQSLRLPSSLAFSVHAVVTGGVCCSFFCFFLVVQWTQSAIFSITLYNLINRVHLVIATHQKKSTKLNENSNNKSILMTAIITR